MPLKTKDVMTIGNIFCGFLASLYAMHGDIEMGSLVLFLGWLIDAFDGTVAKLLKQANKFGGEFDNIADLVSFSMAPSFVSFGFFVERLPFAATLIISSLPLLLGCVRFARFNVKRIEYPGCWIGFPRPASALLIIGVLNSHIVLSQYPLFPDAGTYIAAGIVVASSLGNLTLRPFMGHHNRKIAPYIKVFMGFILGSALLGLISNIALMIDPFLPFVGLGWDIITIWLLCYIFVHQYLVFPKDELADIKAFTREWLAEEKQELSAG